MKLLMLILTTLSSVLAVDYDRTKDLLFYSNDTAIRKYYLPIYSGNIAGQMTNLSVLGEKQDYSAPLDICVSLKDTTNDVHTNNYNSDWSNYSGLTYEAWVKMDTGLTHTLKHDMTILGSNYGRSQFVVSKDGMTLVRQMDTGYVTRSYNPLRIDSTHAIMMVVLGTAKLPTSLFDGKWHYLASDMTYIRSWSIPLKAYVDTTHLRFYVDGALVGDTLVNYWLANTERYNYVDSTEPGSGLVDLSVAAVTVGFVQPQFSNYHNAFIGDMAGYWISGRTRPQSFYSTYWNKWKKYVNYGVNAISTIPVVRTVSAFSAYPNPASNQLTLSFNLREHVSIGAYDVGGRLVSRVFDGQATGVTTVKWNTRGLATGIYTIVMKARQTTCYKITIK